MTSFSDEKLRKEKDLKMIKADIPQDIREYKEQFFFGLNLRQLVCAVIMILLAVGTFLIGHKFIRTINQKLSDRLPFLFGKACYVFRSENALYGTGHIIGRMMIMKTALLLNTL